MAVPLTPQCKLGERKRQSGDSSRLARGMEQSGRSQGRDLFLDQAARDAIARVARRIRLHVVGFGVNH